MTHLPDFRFLKCRTLSGILLLSYLLAGNCFAIVEVLPAYSIIPSINGLNVSYFAKQDKVKIALYIINHERFPVTCDAMYQDGPESKNSREQAVNPEKAIEFSFTYPKKTSNVVIQLICIKPDAAQTADKTKPDVNSSDTATPDSTIIDSIPPIETDLSIPHL